MLFLWLELISNAMKLVLLAILYLVGWCYTGLGCTFLVSVRVRVKYLSVVVHEIVRSSFRK
jgi:hypothetical protein